MGSHFSSFTGNTPSSTASASNWLAGYETTVAARSGHRYSIGERILWRFEDTQYGTASMEPGTIRWLGQVPRNEGIYAGVEMDRLLGTGSGWFDSVQVFTCPDGHGAFLHVEMLVPEAAFADGQPRSPPSPPPPVEMQLKPLKTSTPIEQPAKEPAPEPSDGDWTFSEAFGYTKTPSQQQQPVKKIDEPLALAVVNRDRSRSHEPPKVRRREQWPGPMAIGRGGSDTEEGMDTDDLEADSDLDADGWQIVKQQKQKPKPGLQVPKTYSDKLPKSPLPKPKRQSPLLFLSQAYDSGPKPESTFSGLSIFPTTATAKPEPRRTPPPSPAASASPATAPLPLPWTRTTFNALNSGARKGIQGDSNSCYIDSSLFAMFTFVDIFDKFLVAPSPPAHDKAPPPSPDLDIGRILEQLIEIVSTLRQPSRYPYVSCHLIHRLRSLLAPLNKNYLKEEMDVQEFLLHLFTRVLRPPAFFHYAGQAVEGEFLHQILIATDADSLARLPQVPTVQRLVVESFSFQGLKLKARPDPCFIVQMPRGGGAEGGRVNLFEGVVPSQTLDITELLEDPPAADGAQSRCVLNLFAVTCINTNHFVSYVRVPRDEIKKNEAAGAGAGDDPTNPQQQQLGGDPWLVFDSMSNRNSPGVADQPYGLLPAVYKATELGAWLEHMGDMPSLDIPSLNGLKNTDKFQILLKLLGETYICFYC